MDRTAELKAKIERQQKKKTALLAQSRLMQNIVALAKSSASEQMLTSSLQKALELSVELTKAETGSLFLLDPDGVVRDCILARGPRQPKERLDLTGSVMQDGLAGWVMRHWTIGLITDTQKDERWLKLPDQPYAVRSAMAVPIIRDNEIFGILTLLHSQPGVFHQGTVDVMEVTAGQLGLALENARLYSKLDAYSRALDAELEKGRKIQRDFLPQEFPFLPGWDIAACFHPARQVSGDLYDAFLLPDGCLAVVTEAMSPDEMLYTRRRFLSLLEQPALSAADLIERVKADLFSHIQHAPQSDDITMIAVRRKEQLADTTLQLVFREPAGPRRAGGKKPGPHKGLMPIKPGVSLIFQMIFPTCSITATWILPSS